MDCWLQRGSNSSFLKKLRTCFFVAPGFLKTLIHIPTLKHDVMRHVKDGWGRTCSSIHHKAVADQAFQRCLFLCIIQSPQTQYTYQSALQTKKRYIEGPRQVIPQTPRIATGVSPAAGTRAKQLCERAAAIAALLGTEPTASHFPRSRA
jgi:hypothetical protein